ncbi:MAG: hypothetical protein F6K19_09300 [Cyanothece sp. SIO1E1]|nr:hypothetical protein [Cyanothece sp. SIO1E1]
MFNVNFSCNSSFKRWHQRQLSREVVLSALSLILGITTFTSLALPVYALQFGDRGPEVTRLQDRLNQLGFFNGPSTGLFGVITLEALVEFQRANGLAADGILGPDTQAALERSSSSLSTTSGNILQRGDQGSQVAELQTTLKAVGFYNGPTDGSYGQLTAAAVAKFQQAQGLTVDGIAGPTTQAALKTQAQSLATSAAAQPPIGTGPSGRNSLQTGDRGPQVVELQTQLNATGFYNGPIDGEYGDLTTAAVVAFQQSRGLTTDGIVGPSTQAALQNRAATISNQANNPNGTPGNAATAAVRTTPSNRSLLRLGDSGPAVTNLQQNLKNRGFYDDPITGFYNTQTEQAVVAFQNSSGLTADGIAGPTTLSTLQQSNGINRSSTIQPVTNPVTTPTAVPPTTATPVPRQETAPPITTAPITATPVARQLPVGQSGTPTADASVVEVQKRLKRLGFYSGDVDGVLGPETITAIQAAQEEYRVNPQDIVGTTNN